MLQEGRKENRMTSQFMGYNRQEIIADGEMYDTKNLSGDGFPMIKPRKRRGITAFDGGSKLSGIYNLDGLVYTLGTEVYYKGDKVAGISVSADEDMIPKQIVGMGVYVCIWPDLVYFNTVDQTDCGSMDRKWWSGDHINDWSSLPTPSDAPGAMMCRGDGTDYSENEISVSETAPENPSDGDLWLDESGENDVLRQYSTTMEEWVEVATTYVKITGNKIGEGIQEYDQINIKGLQKLRSTGAPSDKLKKQLDDLNGDHIVYARGEDYIVVAGLLSQAVTLDYWSLKADREIPYMNYICESGNRLWGCRYGLDKNLDKIWSVVGGTNVQLYLCDKTGNEYDYSEITESATAPANPQEGDYWNDISDTENYVAVLKRYITDRGGWTKINTCVKIVATDIGKKLRNGDTIDIEGMYWPRSAYIDIWAQFQLMAMNGKKVIEKAEDDYIVVRGMVNGSYLRVADDDDTITVDRRAPVDTFVNEIRASKLGDFKNWSSFMGLSTDSYAVSVGTDGAFTGAAANWGYPIFFKENCIHRISGSTPSSFQMQTSMSRGVQNGSWRSIDIVNEAMFYKSATDVMMYDGGVPISVSEQLGGLLYEDARAGTINGKYYVSMKNCGVWHHFCYDTKRRTWYREDNLKAMGYATVGDELYAIDEGQNALIGINGNLFNGNGNLEDEFEWEAIFGISGVEYRPAYGGYSRSDLRGSQYMSRFDIRMYLEDGAKMDMWIMYDSDGEWRHQGTIKGNRTKTFVLPVIPRRCDHLRVKLNGKGDFRIYSISRILEAGGDG